MTDASAGRTGDAQAGTAPPRPSSSPLSATSSAQPSGTARSRHPDPSPIDRLMAAPQRFEFHQAVRLLQGHLRRLPAGERFTIRFRNTLSLSFPASEIAGIHRHSPRSDASEETPAGLPPYQAASEPASDRVELTPAFMGLLGTAGAMPLAYTELFAHREGGDRGGSAHAFLDIFQHRAVTLFHEAWRKHRLPLQFEADRNERYLPLALSLAGLGEPALRRRLRAGQGGLSDDTLAFYSGLLQRRTVSASHLQRVLASYFGVPVRVTQFVGRWYALDDTCQASLGASAAHLGRDTLLGPRTWQRDLRVRIGIGPMARAQHRRFLPGGPAALALRELLTLVSGLSLEYEVVLVLRAADVGGITLAGSPEGDADGPRLGWDSHLTSHPSLQDRGEPAYHLHASAA